MRPFKISLILISFFLYIAVAGSLQLILKFGPSAARWRLVNILTHFLIRGLNVILGVRTTLEDPRGLLKEGGHFIITRHVGYIDGLVLAALTPLTFVSKSEVKHWPVLGWVVRVSGTIFINRRQKSAITASLARLQERVRSNINVLLFPEGTSTDGTTIRPFQTPVFAAPLMSQAGILPVVIEYSRIDGRPIRRRDDICWYGQVPFKNHLWHLLQFSSIEATVTVLETIPTNLVPNTSSARKDLAEKCRQIFLTPTASKEAICCR